MNIDNEGIIWFGTNEGLVKYDNSNWEVFTTSNSQLANNFIIKIFVDKENNKWLGTDGGGLIKYDNSNWKIYNSSNSELGSNYINAISMDSNENLWLGTSNGLVKFDGSNFIIYNPSNSNLPIKRVATLFIDKNNYKWISNSDTYGTPLDNSYAGLIIFKGDSTYQATRIENNLGTLPQSYNLSQNYPNPFNPTTKIQFTIPEIAKVTLKIYNILGQEITTLVNVEKIPGTYEVSFTGNGLSSGIYLYRIQAGKYSEVKKMILLK